MVSPKDAPIDHSGKGKKGHAGAAPAPETGEGLVLVTLKADTGTIMKIEAVEPDGSRHDLAPGDAARLAAGGPKSTLESIIHEAFEAGLACVLGGGDRETAEDTGAEGEEAELHDVLLDSLIARSAARRLLRPEVLNSAMLGTIINKASNGSRTGTMSTGT
jgi:hypothetical protein